MSDPRDEMPLNAEFHNFKGGRVWSALEKKLEAIATSEKDKFFDIADDDLQAQRDQRTRAKMAKELTGLIRVFVLNSSM